MSRVGKQPIPLPSNVKVQVNGGVLKVEGPKGKLERKLRPEISVEVADGNTLLVTRKSDAKKVRAFHGMERALINNMVNGVGTGFEKILEFIGVGYRAEMKGKDFVFSLGYSHNIDFKLPVGVTGSLLKEGRDVAIKIEGPDKQLLGQVAAQIRSLRPPEPYKGKGVRYRGEEVKRKAGKAGKK